MNRFVLTIMIVLGTVAAALADRLTFKVSGIDCSACAPPVVKALSSVEGVKSATVDAKAKTATVDVPAGFDRQKLRDAVSNAGFEAVFAGEKPRDIEPLPADIVKTLDILAYTDGHRVDIETITAAGKVTIVDF